jgi:hypothetical protein
MSAPGPFRRTCPVCGAEFEPTHWNQRYRPPTDEQARSRCARRAANAQYRAGS